MSFRTRLIALLKAWFQNSVPCVVHVTSHEQMSGIVFTICARCGALWAVHKNLSATLKIGWKQCMLAMQRDQLPRVANCPCKVTDVCLTAAATCLWHLPPAWTACAHHSLAACFLAVELRRGQRRRGGTHMWSSTKKKKFAVIFVKRSLVIKITYEEFCIGHTIKF